MVKFTTTKTRKRDPKTGKTVTTTRRTPVKEKPRVVIKKIGGKAPRKTSRGAGKNPVYTRSDTAPIINKKGVVTGLSQRKKQDFTEEEMTGSSGAPVESSKTGILESTYNNLGTTKKVDPLKHFPIRHPIHSTSTESKPDPMDNITEFGIGPTVGMFTTAGAGAAGSLISRLKNLGSLKVAVGKTGKQVQTTLTGAPAFVVNTKTATTAGSALKKVFSAKTLAVAGGWASSVFLGQWGQAESAEPLGFVIRDLTKEALKTGDWSLVDEAQAARSEITDLALWEQVMLWTPGAPLIGIPNKIKGVGAAAVIQDKYINDLRVQAENSESDDDKWVRLREEKAAQEKANIDYYNGERKKLVEWEAEARRNNMVAEAGFWAKERAKQRKLEEEDRIAQAKFWEEYKKEQQKFQESQRPSKLNFGLI